MWYYILYGIIITKIMILYSDIKNIHDIMYIVLYAE